MALQRPLVAIIDPNTLAVLGFQSLLQEVMPALEVEAFSTMSELEANHPERFAHFFVAMSIALAHRPFFLNHRRQTIVLTLSHDGTATGLSDFHALRIDVPEKMLVRELLQLEQHAHHGGQHLPPMPAAHTPNILSDREIEVMSLVAQGLANKEIADKLCISLNTAVTHRRNIMAKLNLKSVSSLTIYAVMHGYVDINKI